jgi:hypothetical protein
VLGLSNCANSGEAAERGALHGNSEAEADGLGDELPPLAG